MVGCDVSYRSPGLQACDGLCLYPSSAKEAAENEVRHETPVVGLVLNVQVQLLIEGT